MGLEPRVLEAIKTERRRERSYRYLIRVSLVAAVIACGAAIALRFTVFGSSLEELGAMNYGFLIGLGILFFLLMTVLFRMTRIWGGSNDTVAAGFEEAGAIGGAGARVFGDALEGVAIGAGVTVPGLLSADVPTVNSFPVFRAESYYMGVTREAIDQRLSPGEAEAMAANCVARILLGRVWNAPAIWQSGLVPFVLLGILAVALCAAFVVYVPGTLDNIGLIVIGGFLIAVALPTVGRFLFWRSDVVRSHGDVLADSIAVKITGDPVTYRNLVARLADRSRMVEFTFELQVVSRYLFVCPPGSAYGPEVHEELEGAAGTGEEVTRERVSRAVARKTTKYGARSLVLRLSNLQAIERGNWRAFGEE